MQRGCAVRLQHSKRRVGKSVKERSEPDILVYCLEDFQFWLSTNKKTHARIKELIKQATRTPFTGVGKPELLRGDISGWWSRCISPEDRMVYRVAGIGEAQSLEIAQLRFHYWNVHRWTRQNSLISLVYCLTSDSSSLQPSVLRWEYQQRSPADVYFGC